MNQEALMEKIWNIMKFYLLTLTHGGVQSFLFPQELSVMCQNSDSTNSILVDKTWSIMHAAGTQR